jgi:hypothetical protein
MTVVIKCPPPSTQSSVRMGKLRLGERPLWGGRESKSGHLLSSARPDSPVGLAQRRRREKDARAAPEEGVKVVAGRGVTSGIRH